MRGAYEAVNWQCGHAKTRENTTTQGKCRFCFNAYHREWARAHSRSETPDERRQRYRINYLPRQLESARLKVLHLEREAARLGMRDLLTNPASLDQAWEREIELAKVAPATTTTTERKVA